MNKQCAALAVAITFSAAAHAQDGNWAVFGGVDVLQHEVSVTVPIAAPNVPGALGSTRRVDGDGNSVRLRGGMWLNEDFSVEIQGSVSSDEVDTEEVAEIDSYVGAFISARAQPFDWLHLSFPVGVTSIEATVPDPDEENPDDSCEFDDNGDLRYCPVTAKNESIAYGMNFDFRLGSLLSEPDSVLAGLDIGLGFMVYNSSGNASVRGYNAGVKFGYDF